MAKLASGVMVMTAKDYRELILDELHDVPPEQLESILRLIRDHKRSLRPTDEAGLEASPLSMAGAWSDMNEEEAREILQLYARRESYWTLRDIDV
jgi:transcriptional regulator with AAA-type ATPase domain